MASSQTSLASTDGDDHHHHHIVMIPYMAQGHIIPFIALAKLLEHRTHYTITFATSPHNIPAVQSALPPNTTIHLAAFPFNGSDDGLPPAAENTNTLPFTLPPSIPSLPDSLARLRPPPLHPPPPHLHHRRRHPRMDGPDRQTARHLPRGLHHIRRLRRRCILLSVAASPTHQNRVRYVFRSGTSRYVSAPPLPAGFLSQSG
ncbi:hypothetical protein AAC387_Pa06g1154 [Persea americana]